MLATLRSRGLVNAVTHEGFDSLLQQKGGISSFYTGFDPTADGLHVGSLVQLMTMRWLQRLGMRPIALVGGASGLIGDPSGRSTERNLLGEDDVRHNSQCLATDIQRVVPIDGSISRGPASSTDAILVNNMDWYQPMSSIAFLRDVGKHFRVNTMLSRDSVRSRMETEAGISFTEFAYQALQAHDFAHLAKEHGCVLQTGGSDQWGNIVGGVDLVRRTTGSEVYGLTTPLLTTATGEKFGKSAGNAIWLSPEKTSDFAFYQYFLGQPDADMRSLLLMLTERPVPEVDEICEAHAAAPHERAAQRALADDVTGLVRGTAGLATARHATGFVFGKAPTCEADAAAEVLQSLDGVVPYMRLPASEIVGSPIVALCAKLGVAASKAEAKRLVKARGLSVGGRRIADDSDAVRGEDLWHGRFLVLKPGKKKFFVVDVGTAD